MLTITSRHKFLTFLMKLMKTFTTVIFEKQTRCSTFSEISMCTLRMISVCTYSLSVLKLQAKVSLSSCSKKP
ncbi:hypothetical protein NY2A_b855L [Paramecium bursaria Chlorella virus NY2A]|uniref:Uncharacterized protein b855L n=1 Tax=Paramecium bursaria Chlorella virus NY2A TaxID=46021 RepID=A7IY30_PBCVN|nr:hypothetical protein NY2A_b855L [Paramecium bursaria Chlorella virus NY2A]ABT15254.1 hypothetical protein NY2A_b855L [Paramecium bursaria Chlorella virus NY2A]